MGKGQTYVAYRAQPKGLDIEDYRLLDNPVEVCARFKMVQRLLTEVNQIDSQKFPEFRERIWSDGIKSRAFYIVGASMARCIEENKSRNTLIRTVVSGAQSFFAEYSATSPPPDLSIPVP